MLNFFKKNKVYVFLGLIIFLGLFLRILPLITYFHEQPGLREGLILYGDAKGYHDLSMIFFNHGVNGIFDLSNDVYKSPEIPYLTAFRTPLYPYFISLVYGLKGENMLLVLVFQTVINVMTIFLVFKISVLAFKNKYLSLFAAFLYAISPLAIVYSVSMYAESFFTFFFTLTILSFIYACKRNHLSFFIATGLLLGLTTLIKPITLYFLPVFFISLFFYNKSFVKDWKKYLIKCLVLSICFLAVLTPWQLRNFYLFKHYAVSFQQGRELLVWRVGTCISSDQNLNKEAVWTEIQKPYLNIPDIFERSKAEQQTALKYIYNNPVTYLKCSLKGAVKFFITKDMIGSLGIGKNYAFLEYINSIGVSANYFRYFNINKDIAKNISDFYVVLLYLQYLIILIGSYFLLKNKEVRGFVIFGIFSVMYFVLVAGVDGYFRYRYPVAPILILLTSASIWSIVESLINKKKTK